VSAGFSDPAVVPVVAHPATSAADSSGRINARVELIRTLPGLLFHE
jgi:hypothetical protein